MARTHYQTLQVTEDASDEVIRGAYRYLSQRWHPDRHSDRVQAEAMQRELNVAYAVLSDPQARREYDCALAGERHEGHGREHAQTQSAGHAPVLEPKRREELVNKLAGRHGWVVAIPATYLTLLVLVRGLGLSGWSLLACLSGGLFAKAAWDAWRRPRYQVTDDATLIAEHLDMQEGRSRAWQVVVAILVVMGLGYYGRERDAMPPVVSQEDATLATPVGGVAPTQAPQVQPAAPAMRAASLGPDQYVKYSFDVMRPAQVQVAAVLEQGPPIDVYLFSADNAARWEAFATTGQATDTPVLHYPALGIEGLQGQFASEWTALDAGAYVLLLENTDYGRSAPAGTPTGDTALLRYSVTAE